MATGMKASNCLDSLTIVCSGQGCLITDWANVTAAQSPYPRSLINEPLGL